MPYLHKKTFEISARVCESINIPKDYFYVEDDLIALIVQTLNQKGYYTNGCCIGHVHSTIMNVRKPMVKEHNSELKEYIDAIAAKHSTFAKKEELPSGLPCSFIIFKKGVTLPSLPPGFVRYEFPTTKNSDTLLLQKFYTSDDAYENVCAIFDTMKDLYKWAQSLPPHS